MLALLQQYDIIKEGNFTLKDGTTSQYYVNLREAPSHPKLFKSITQTLCRMIVSNPPYDAKHIVGIPLAGIPLATGVSMKLERSSLLLRKDQKEYGTKKMIEGKYHHGDTVILIDDVITSSQSKKDAIEMLGRYGLKCVAVYVVVDRRTEELRRDMVENNILGCPIYSLIEI